MQVLRHLVGVHRQAVAHRDAPDGGRARHAGAQHRTLAENRRGLHRRDPGAVDKHLSSAAHQHVQVVAWLVLGDEDLPDEQGLLEETIRKYAQEVAAEPLEQLCLPDRLRSELSVLVPRLRHLGETRGLLGIPLEQGQHVRPGQRTDVADHVALHRGCLRAAHAEERELFEGGARAKDVDGLRMALAKHAATATGEDEHLLTLCVLLRHVFAGQVDAIVDHLLQLGNEGSVAILQQRHAQDIGKKLAEHLCVLGCGLIEDRRLNGEGVPERRQAIDAELPEDAVGHRYDIRATRLAAPTKRLLEPPPCAPSLVLRVGDLGDHGLVKPRLCLAIKHAEASVARLACGADLGAGTVETDRASSKHLGLELWRRLREEPDLYLRGVVHEPLVEQGAHDGPRSRSQQRDVRRELSHVQQPCKRLPVYEKEAAHWVPPQTRGEHRRCGQAENDLHAEDVGSPWNEERRAAEARLDVFGVVREGDVQPVVVLVRRLTLAS
mmetsp:Transcript_74289/g.215282  ORF Transcript_74289/g.215282 Transcript_74289/m.215282 type:complete len:494 (+) Transcript_74289:427-1908(+)